MVPKGTSIRATSRPTCGDGDRLVPPSALPAWRLLGIAADTEHSGLAWPIMSPNPELASFLYDAGDLH
jgi:hypothetical protein